MLGAGAALLYAATREMRPLARSAWRALAAEPDGSASASLVDWGWAERIAIQAAGRAPTLHPAARDHLQRQYAALLREIEAPLATYTGSGVALDSTSVEVLDRPGWIRANMAGFRALLQPVDELYRESLRDGRAGVLLPANPAMHQAGRLLLSAELGLLVGYLARRVLGQYDLALLGSEPTPRGKLYFVEPNLLQVELALALPGRELRRWVALHEATHVIEFEQHPWVRDYLNASLRAYLRLLVDDLRRKDGSRVLADLAGRLAANLRRGHNLVSALMTPEQRALMSRLQALMSLAEGYSNHVMNTVGRSLLPSFDTIHERVERRQRQRSQAEMAFLRITGLSMKMEQYRRGEQFVDAVARERGIAFANRAWNAPELLPTEAELAEPRAWISRVEATA